MLNEMKEDRRYIRYSILNRGMLLVVVPYIYFFRVSATDSNGGGIRQTKIQADKTHSLTVSQPSILTNTNVMF